MSVESFVLYAWEEAGFVGRTRVPLGKSDIDVLAVQPNDAIVRIGQVKAQRSSQTVHTLDACTSAGLKSGKMAAVECIGGEWFDWLKSLPGIWSADGQSTVPWLPNVGRFRVIEVHFFANVWFFGEKNPVENALRQVATERLHENPAIREVALEVRAFYNSTADTLIRLTDAVCRKIRGGYGRRFGEPVRDAIREIHRYLFAELEAIPLNENDIRCGTSKEPFAAEIRKKTALSLLEAFGINREELRRWLDGSAH